MGRRWIVGGRTMFDDRACIDEGAMNPGCHAHPWYSATLEYPTFIGSFASSCISSEATQPQIQHPPKMKFLHSVSVILLSLSLAIVEAMPTIRASSLVSRKNVSFLRHQADCTNKITRGLPRCVPCDILCLDTLSCIMSNCVIPSSGGVRHLRWH